MTAALTRRYPLYSGCAKVALHSWTRLISGESNDAVWTRCPGGNEVLAPLNDYVGRVLYFIGDLDPKVTWICRRVVRPGDTVVDIGANIGLVTMVLSSIVGRDGTVHAFEPNPRVAGLLRQTIERNGAGNVQLHDVALGEKDGVLELVIPRRNTGGASLVRLDRSDADRVAVQVSRLSDALASCGPIRLMKVDVEGFEPQVFRGGERLFSEQRPALIIFEVNQSSGHCKDHPAFQILSQYGYRFFALPRRFLRVHVQPLDLSRPIRGAGHDFLAAPKETYREMAELLGVRDLSRCVV